MQGFFISHVGGFDFIAKLGFEWLEKSLPALFLADPHCSPTGATQKLEELPETNASLPGLAKRELGRG